MLIIHFTINTLSLRQVVWPFEMLLLSMLSSGVRLRYVLVEKCGVINLARLAR